LKNGDKKYFYVPLDLTNNLKTDFLRPTNTLAKWSCASTKYTVSLSTIKWKEIESIRIDPDGFLPDVNLEDNRFQKE
jgi:hypothetical protein